MTRYFIEAEVKRASFLLLPEAELQMSTKLTEAVSFADVSTSEMRPTHLMLRRSEGTEWGTRDNVT